MRLAARIRKLEAKEGSVESGKLPISVVDCVVNGTISDQEFERWFPLVQAILSVVLTSC